MTDGAMTPLSTLRANAADSPEAAPDATRRRRRPSGYLLLNAGGWLLFGVAMMIGSLDVMPWDVILATEPVYVLIGFLLSLLLGRVYDRLGVEPTSFGRTLAISVAGGGGVGGVWAGALYYYPHPGAGIPPSV